MVDDFVARRGRRRAHSSGSRDVVERSRAGAATRPGSAASRRCWSRARRKKDPAIVTGPHPPEQARALRPGRDDARGRRHVADVRDHVRRAALPARRAASRAAPAPRAGASASRSPRRDAPRAPHLALVGPTASGKSALALDARPRGSATSRSSRSTRCRCTGAWTSAPPSRPPPSGPRCRTTCSTSPTRARTGRSRGSRPRRAPRSPTSRRAASGRCSSAAPACTCRRWSTTSRFPGEDPRVRAELEAEHADAGRTRRRVRASSQRLDPVAAARIEPDNARRIVRALEVIELTGRPFSSFGPGPRTPTAPPCSRCAIVGRVAPARRARPPHRSSGSRAMRDAGPGRRGPRARRDRGGCRGPPARPSATRSCSPTSTATSRRSTPPLDAAVRRTRPFARRQRVWFRRDPRITWFGTADESVRDAARPAGKRGAR